LEEKEGQETKPRKFDAFYPIFSAYFAEWTQCLEFPRWDYRPGEYRFKVSLSASIWRRIAISGDTVWAKLASAVLDAFDFDHDHLYEFLLRDPTWRQVSLAHYYMDEGPYADEVVIGALPLEVGEELVFHYDFGDDWRFLLRLEAHLPENSELKGVVVMERHGVAPIQYPSTNIRGSIVPRFARKVRCAHVKPQSCAQRTLSPVSKYRSSNPHR